MNRILVAAGVVGALALAAFFALRPVGAPETKTTVIVTERAPTAAASTAEASPPAKARASAPAAAAGPSGAPVAGAAAPQAAGPAGVAADPAQLEARHQRREVAARQMTAEMNRRLAGCAPGVAGRRKVAFTAVLAPLEGDRPTNPRQVQRGVEALLPQGGALPADLTKDPTVGRCLAELRGMPVAIEAGQLAEEPRFDVQIELELPTDGARAKSEQEGEGGTDRAVR